MSIIRTAFQQRAPRQADTEAMQRREAEHAERQCQQRVDARIEALDAAIADAIECVMPLIGRLCMDARNDPRGPTLRGSDIRAFLDERFGKLRGLWLSWIDDDYDPAAGGYDPLCDQNLQTLGVLAEAAVELYVQRAYRDRNRR